MKRCLIALFAILGTQPSFAADPVVIENRWRHGNVTPRQAMVAAQVFVVSGNTLWFPNRAIEIKLANIDACAVAQWSFDPKRTSTHSSLRPVPCGAFSKAWLKRFVASDPVTCLVSHSRSPVALSGRCSVRGRDLGLEMLRVGWAKLDRAGGADLAYQMAENTARAARYGLWGTYVLDPSEWRRKVVDQTLDRRPIADENLLRSRQSEITPPFADWRNRPRRNDR